MMLSGVLFVLILAGCWLYCLADVALTPAAEFRGLSKASWVGIIAATFIVGAIAWLITRRSWRPKSRVTIQVSRTTSPRSIDTDPAWFSTWAAAEAAVTRHPAGRFKQQQAQVGSPFAKGPDDDPEFLRQLDQRIHGTSADPGE